MDRLRIGHTRPPGTTKRIRMHGWTSDEPELGQLCYDHPYELERAYEIVGIEEVARPGRWNLILERLDWTTAIVRACESDGWAFSIIHYPR